MVLSKHLMALLSFKPIVKGKIAEPAGDLPIDHEVPKPVFLFGKEISVQGSLYKWEENLTTNTLTNYDS